MVQRKRLGHPCRQRPGVDGGRLVVSTPLLRARTSAAEQRPVTAAWEVHDLRIDIRIPPDLLTSLPGHGVLMLAPECDRRYADSAERRARIKVHIGPRDSGGWCLRG